MITPITRTLYGTYVAANSTIVFASNPYLLANNALTLYFTNNDVRFAAKVVSTSANNVVVDFTNTQYSNTAVAAVTPHWNSGITGPQQSFSWNKVVPPVNLIQATYLTTGANTANVTIETSADGIGWINVADINLSGTANTNYFTSNTPWPYARLNVNSISANTGFIVTKAQ